MSHNAKRLKTKRKNINPNLIKRSHIFRQISVASALFLSVVKKTDKLSSIQNNKRLEFFFQVELVNRKSEIVPSLLLFALTIKIVRLFLMREIWIRGRPLRTSRSFGQSLTFPTPIITLFITKALVLPSQNH